MPVRPVLLYPNPVLRQPALPADPCNPLIHDIVQDLWDTLDDHAGVGLAAPQIGYRVQIIVVDATRARQPCPNHGRVTLLNPEILVTQGRIRFREGCLSIPDLVAYIQRAEQVTVAGLLPDGSRACVTPQGFEAVIFQHEMDHLAGLLFIDRVRSARDLKPRAG